MVYSIEGHSNKSTVHTAAHFNYFQAWLKCQGNGYNAVEIGVINQCQADIVTDVVKCVNWWGTLGQSLYSWAVSPCLSSADGY